jgi:hypothetical protein
MFMPHPDLQKPPVPLKFSACFHTLTVNLTPDVMNLLLEPVKLYDQQVSHFDRWFHKQVMHARNDYNRL